MTTPSFRLGVVTLATAAALVAGCRAPRAGGAGETPPPDTAAAASADTVTLAGWLNIVWNHETRVTLTEEPSGRVTELSLPEEAARPHGGPLRLNRTRVVVTGLRTGPGRLRVLSLRPDTAAAP